jgi:uncharacterized protein
MRSLATEPVGATDDVEIARRIVLDRLKGRDCSVFLFGSRAHGKPRRSSDIDVAVLPREPLPPGLLAEIAEALEESPILCSVDLVDLLRCDEDFRRRVLSEGQRWTE